MLLFLLTSSITVAILVSGVISVLVFTNPKVLKWYLRKVNKVTNEIVNDLMNETEDL